MKQRGSGNVGVATDVNKQPSHFESDDWFAEIYGAPAELQMIGARSPCSGQRPPSSNHGTRSALSQSGASCHRTGDARFQLKKKKKKKKEIS
ncbi:hypothetical protein EYF80_020947 [Liparis tanakae]|uniref:Uncharacterized protein n=1 Tax=Liparis tanakae TaxID=230148 RepID=A0A4Z2HSE0_9TELE|nr:hypothetical protein EYF80_020947 [Liparis tanakae]